jgi:hypothetical protein
MIYLIIGGSCAGKTQFVKNSFLKGKHFEQYKDLVTVCETDTDYIVGRYDLDMRQLGTDRISRADIPKFFDQIKKLYVRGKNVVLEGDKISSHKLFQQIADSGMKATLIWINLSIEESIRRNEKLGFTGKVASLKRPLTKCKNLYDDFKDVFPSYEIDADSVPDYSTFSIQTADMKKYEPKKKACKTLRDDFCVLILTHGRADRVYTLKTLSRQGYTGPVILVVDNEDDQVDEYIRRYGKENVVVFDKGKRAETTDVADVVPDHRSVVYARNESFDIAEKLGYRYFLELDDDYSEFMYRYADGDKLAMKKATDLDTLFEYMLRFLDDTGAVTVAFAQGGDMIGGTQNRNFRIRILRKAMNTFFCDTHKRFDFVGRINEDVNTYVLLGSQGKLIFTYSPVMITQKQTQSNEGGWTEVYLERGTYVKSFYSVIFNPSSVKISEMGDKHMRIHHLINWDKCSPQILNQKWKKAYRGAVNDAEGKDRSAG